MVRPTEVQLVNQRLSGALASGVVIEQAMGAIAECAGIEIPEAFSGSGATPGTTPCWPRSAEQLSTAD